MPLKHSAHRKWFAFILSNDIKLVRSKQVQGHSKDEKNADAKKVQFGLFFFFLKNNSTKTYRLNCEWNNLMSQDGKLEECSLFPKTTYLDSCIISPTFFLFVCFSNFSNLIAPSCVYRGTTFSHQPVLLYPHQVHRLKQRELHCMNFPVNKLKLKYFIVPGKWQESTVKE